MKEILAGQNFFHFSSTNKMSAWPHKINTIIFDNDGTFLDSLNIYIDATEQVIGQPIRDTFYKKVNGMNAYNVAKNSIAEFHMNMTPEQFLEKRDKIVVELLGDVNPFPGAPELAKEFKRRGYKIGLATSSNNFFTDLKFSKLPELKSLFDVIITCDDVKEAKPDPEIFLQCAKKLGAKPENCLVFEDAMNGIVAANRAGMASAFFANGNMNYKDDFEKIGGIPNTVFQRYDEFDRSAFTWE